MSNERSINGPIMSAQTLLMRGHPSANPNLCFHDQEFENLCISLDVPKYQLDKDRVLQLGKRIDVTPAPTTDFDFEPLDNSYGQHSPEFEPKP